VLVAPLLVAPLLVLVAPLLVPVDPFPAGSSPAVPLPPVPVLVDPMAGPPDGESVGLVPAPPGTGELDAGVTGVEEPLPAVDEDAGAFGLLAVWVGSAALVVHEGVGVALADASPVAFAEAVEVALLMVVAVAVPAAGAVAVVLSPGLVPPPGPSLVALAVALPDGVLTELAGVPLGVAVVAGLAAFVDVPGADDAEPGAHPIAGALPWAAEVPPPAPPAVDPAGVAAPFVL
jgi:hypothetical protein